MEWFSQHPIKAGLDLIAVSTIAASWTGWITPVATLLGTIWVAIQIVEWAIQKWAKKRQPRE